MSDRDFIYAILVSYGLPLIPTILTFELFTGLSNHVFLLTEVNCLNIKADCHVWSAFDSEPFTLPPISDVSEEVSIAIRRVEELISSVIVEGVL